LQPGWWTTQPSRREPTDDVKAIDQVRKEVGMVVQQFNLFPHLAVLENLPLSPMWVGKMPRREAEEASDPKTFCRRFWGTALVPAPTQAINRSLYL